MEKNYLQDNSNNYFQRYLLLLAIFLSVGVWGQVNITPARSAVSGFGTWTDTDVAGTTYLQLLKATSSTVTPAMNFDSYTNETLDFKARTFGGTTAAEIILTVSISTDNGGTWTVLGTRTPASSTLVSQTQFDLSSYSGTQVKVKFSVAGTNDAIGVGISEINIKGIAASPTTPSLAISAPSSLVENTLNSSTINLTLSNDTFVNATPTASNFTLNNTPSGLTIASVVRNTATTATITLAYDYNIATDFDTNIANLSVTASNSELGTSTSALTSGALTINAVNEAIISSSLTAFGNACVNNTVGPNSFNLSSSTVLKAGTISLATLSGYTYSETSTGTYTSTLSFAHSGGNLSSKTIYVKFSPIAATAYNGNIVVSGGGSANVNVAASGTGVTTATPTNTIAITTGSNPMCGSVSTIFTATASNLGGGVASYQWKLNGLAAGTNSSTYTLAAPSNNDTVSCDVTIAGGCVTTNSVSSNTISLIVNALPATPATPTSDSPQCSPASVTITRGTPPIGETWYWQTTASGVSTSNSSATYSVSTAGNTTVYLRSQNNTSFCWSTNSANITVTVNAPISITTQPTSQSKNVGSTATYSVIATGTISTYQWQVSTDCGGTWNNVTASDGTGGTTNSFTTVATTNSMDGNKYRVLITGTCGNVTSATVGLTLVSSSQCLFSDFISSEGWSNVAYGAASPWTQTIGGNVWTGSGINVSAGSSRLQIKDLSTWIQLPNLNNAASLVINAQCSSSGTGGTDDLKLQYNNSGVWTDVSTITIGSAGNFTYDLSALTGVSNLSLRLIKMTSTATLYINSLTVNCTTLPSVSTDYTWNGSASTSWADACNWTPKGVPTSVDNVIFNTSPSNLLNITDGHSVKNFTLNGTGNFSIASTGSLTIAGNVTYGGTATATLDCASNVKISSSSSQPIPPLNYGNLDILGGDRVFPNGGTIGICNAFAVSPSYNYTVTGSTINYSSPSPNWVLTPFTYYNLKISGSGDFSLGYSNTNTDKTVNVLGDYTQTAGTLFIGDTSSNKGTLNIKGNATISGGILDINNNTATGSQGIVNLEGDLTVGSSGKIKATFSPTATFNFTGTGDGLSAATTQTIDVANASPTSNIVFNTNSGSYVKIINQDFALGTNSKFNVLSGSTLDFGFNGTTALNLARVTSTLGQSFSSEAGSTLKITSQNGISNGASVYTGNVQVGATTTARVFNAGATYYFIGKANAAQVTANGVDQISGNGMPNQITGKVIIELDTQNSTQDDVAFKPAGIITLGTTGGVNGLLEIRKGKVVDEPSNGFRNYMSTDDGETDTQRGDIKMTGGRYVVSGSGTKPALSGTYTLSAGTVEFAGTSATKIRTSSSPVKQYYNVDVSGTGVQTGGKSFIVNNLLKVISATAVFTIPEVLDNENPYVVTASKGIQVVTNAKVLFKNNANLIQDKDAANSGNITMERKANVPSVQYNYWTSPVKNQALYSLYDVPTDKVMVYNSANDKFTVLTTASNPQSVFAKGYSVKGSPTIAPALTTTFVGEPNNETTSGTNSIPLSILGSNYNLVGNPYPSNLDLTALYNDAANTAKFYNQVDESPTVYLWDNTSNSDLNQIGSTYSTYTQNNYALFNLSAGIGNPAPRTGATKKPNGIVKPGQGFIMRAAETAGQSLSFKNSFRTTAVKVGVVDGVYYKGAAETIDKYWLRLTTPNNLNIVIALAYNPDAENSFERFDSTIFSESVSENFYSLSSDSKKLAIQTKKGNFDIEDKIPLGIKTFSSGDQKIGIDDKDGIFNGSQNVYLKDKLLNKIINLSQEDYTFQAATGTDLIRFEIVYKDDLVLAADASSRSDFNVYRDRDSFVIKSSKKLGKVEMYDASGKLVRQLSSKDNELRINVSDLPNAMYIIKAENAGDTRTKKVIK